MWQFSTTCVAPQSCVSLTGGQADLADRVCSTTYKNRFDTVYRMQDLTILAVPEISSGGVKI